MTFSPLRISCVLLLTGLLAVPAARTSPARAAEGPEQIDVFTSGSEGYHTYRIPGIVLSTKGTLLAFCEGRKTGRSDHGQGRRFHPDLIVRGNTRVCRGTSTPVPTPCF